MCCTFIGTHSYAQEHAHHEESQADAVIPTSNIEGLILNNGQKWEMDDHTRKSFKKMEDLFR